MRWRRSACATSRCPRRRRASGTRYRKRVSSPRPARNARPPRKARMTSDARLHKGRKRVNVALQGGGAHGAFTWGVLERLIGDGRIFIDGLSGTSAGAMNAVVFTDGFVRGRQRGAIDALTSFWRRVSEGALVPSGWAKAMAPLQSDWNMDSAPAFQMLDAITRM